MARVLFVVTRLAIAVAVCAAIVAQLRSSIDFAGAQGHPDAANVTVNFLSYFTVDSNSLTAIVLVVGAVLLLRRPTTEPRGFTMARVAVTTYMIITGVVYNLLLRGLPVGAVVTWSNEILHVVAPAYLVLDWLFAPSRGVLRARDALPALAFPIVWITYTLLRGPHAKDPYTLTAYWYPYPFINPVTSAGGYLSVSAYIVGIAVAVVAIAFALTWTSRLRRPATATA